MLKWSLLGAVVTKRISCKVIRSVPLTKGNEILVYVKQSDGEGERMGVFAAKSSWAKHTVDSVLYTDRLGAEKASIDEGLIGQILDFYA